MTVPVYAFRCSQCEESDERLLPLGQTAEERCARCGGLFRLRFGRVAVRYAAWGFNATDRLAARPGEHPFRSVRDKAEEIGDG